jgi:hypothetical protein
MLKSERELLDEAESLLAELNNSDRKLGEYFENKIYYLLHEIDHFFTMELVELTAKRDSVKSTDRSGQPELSQFFRLVTEEELKNLALNKEEPWISTGLLVKLPGSSETRSLIYQPTPNLQIWTESPLTKQSQLRFPQSRLLERELQEPQ